MIMFKFCARCAEKDTQYEVLMKQYQKELECCKTRITDLKKTIARLEHQNECLVLDVAFYNKDICFTTKGDV